MSFDDPLCRDTRASLKGVDVPRETYSEKALIGEQLDEGMCDGGSKFSRI